ncbi:MAG: leucine-rich repeat protein [Acutalibacteraceae bacterium]
MNNNAFYNCESLKSVTIDNGVTSIGSYAFYSCNSLKSVTIGNGVTSIGYGAFEWCNNLEDVTIPDSVTYIGAYAFGWCYSLTNITIGKSITKIDSSAFNFCDELQNIYITDIAAWCKIAFEDYNANPLSYAKKLYLNNELLTELVIPDDITSIGSYAFYGCSSLSSAIIPESVESIGEQCFKNCSALDNIEFKNPSCTIPSSSETISPSAVIFGIEGSTAQDYAQKFARSFESKAIESLKITKLPSKTTYECYEDFDSTGLEVEVTYADGTSSILTKGLKVTGFNSEEAGTQTLTVHYGSASATFEVTVNELTISLEESEYILYNEKYSYQYVKFTPPVSGSYRFYMPRNRWTFASITLCDADKNRIASDSWDWEDCYFTNDLKGGNIYYYKLSLNREDAEDIINYSVHISMDCLEAYCDHLNKVNVPGKAQTCDEDGYTDGVQCTDCGIWLSGHQMIKRHFDENNDMICDKCGIIISAVVQEGNCGDDAVYTVYENGTMVISGSGEMYDKRFCSNYSNITNIIIKDGITTIGTNAFDNYYNLTSVIIPDSVTSIGYSAFCNCDNLENVTIPDSVTYIGEYAFYWCDSLTNITIGKNVENIASYAFRNCRRLKKVEWKAINAIANKNTFYNCAYYNDGFTVNFVDGVESVPADVFNSDQVKSVSFPSTLKTIGARAFKGTSLSEVIIPESVETIEDSAFFKCGAESVIIKGNINTIGNSAFSTMPNLKTVTVEGNAVLGSNIFSYCHALETVEISGNVQSIPVDAFYMSENLKSVTLPESVAVIGDAAFAGCYALTSINLPEGIKKLPYNAFASCRSLEHIELPSTLEMIGDDVFYDCISLTDIVIPKSVKRIGPSIFYNCNNLSSIEILNPDCEIYASEYTINDSAVIFGKENSTAQKYAKTYGRIFETRQVESVSLVTKPDRTEYYMGDEFDVRGLSITVQYEGGETETLKNIGSVSGFNSKEIGTSDVCITFGGKKTESFDVTINERTITLKETVKVTVQPGQRAYFKFVPKVSGYYYADINGYYDAYAKLLDSNLKLKYKYFDSEHNSYLIAGETYYICTGLRNYGYTDGEDYSYELTLEARNLNCPHNNTETIAKVDATCEEVGYTDGVFCHDCETWISGHELIPSHVDKNNDMICDICNKDISKSVKTGRCGKSATFDLYENGTLYIHGTGSIASACEWDDTDYGKSFTKLIIDEGITEIGSYAFKNCRSLETAVLPESLKVIGDYAFAVNDYYSSGEYIGTNISALKSVNLGPNVETIGNGAFEKCVSLEKLELPASLKEIGCSAFSGVGFDSITIPKSVESVRENAFSSYYDEQSGKTYGIKEITLEQGFKNISYGMFENSLIESIVVPDSVTSIGNYAFTNCAELTSVTLPQTITQIGENAFANCEKLSNINIPDSVTRIDEDAFANCKRLDNVVINNKDVYIGYNAFSNSTTVQSYWSVYERSGCNYNFKPFESEKVEIVTLPEKLSYKTGESFSQYGLTLKVTYKDGYSETVNDKFSISGFDSETAGNKKINVSFGGASDEFNVKVVDYSDLTITAESTRNVCVNGTQAVYLKFIPTKTASYTFSSSAFGKDTYGYLCDSEKNVITEDDDSAGSGNFSITAQLVEGTKYYFAVRFVNESEWGTFDVTLSENDPAESSVCNHSFIANVTPATCIIPEFTTFTCTNCGFSYTTITKAAEGHNLVSEKAAIANCVNDGLTVYSCAKCDYSRVEVNPALGHNYSYEWTIDIQSTCIEPGSKSHHCSRCDSRSDITEIPETSHNYSTVVTEATCTTEGYTTHTCTVCGDTYTDSKIPALGHSFTNYVSDRNATCTKDGTKTAKCDRCGTTNTIADKGSAKGHTPGAWITDKDSDCTTSGTKHQICSVCGETIKTETIPTKGHKYVATVTAPTCMAEGYTTHKCSVCGDVYTDSKVPATGKHTNKTTTTKATTSKDGKVVTTCSVCKTTLSTTTIYKASSVNLSKTSFTYNGKVQKPTVTVKNSKGTALKNGTDYTVSYSSGCKNTGKYAVKITFKGNYSGSKTLTFNILPSKTSKLTATQSTTSIKATWKAVTGASGYKVTLYSSKDKALKTIYTTNTTYTFSKLSKGTTYKVRVTAYKTIDSKKVSSSVYTQLTTATKTDAPSIKVSSSAKKTAKISWSKVTGATGYTVYYSTSKNGTYKKLATTTGTSYTNKKLSSGKTYYFKVAAYKTVDGKNIYGAYSSVKYAKIK